MNDDSELSGQRGRWATGGAVVAAIAASSCCILPLVLSVAGISTASFAGFFASARPAMLGLTVLLLGFGFYYTYLRKPGCASGAACEAAGPDLGRLNRSILWLATIAVVALVFFPSYAIVFTTGDAPTVANFESSASKQVVLEVDGMTCEACTVSVQHELATVPGVVRSEVDFPSGKTTVFVKIASPPSTRELLSAVDRAGYSAVLASSGTRGEG